MKKWKKHIKLILHQATLHDYRKSSTMQVMACSNADNWQKLAALIV
jgi:hypothetical protein